MERSGGGRPRQDGYDLGRGNRDLCVLLPRIVHIACAGSIGLELGFLFFFFSLDSSFFFKDGILTRIALYMLGTGWKDSGIAVGGGGGGTPTTKRAVSGPVFIFKNRQMPQWSLSPSQEE